MSIKGWEIVISDDEIIKLWNIMNNQCITAFSGHNSSVNCIIQLEDNILASFSNNTTLRLWNNKFIYVIIR